MKTSLRKRFGERAKELRLASGISQEAFADKCGYARSYMSRIERGLANPSLDFVEVVAVALKVEVKVLFETTGVGLPTAKAMLQTLQVPFAADGSCFNPTLRRPKVGTYTVGKKGHLITFDTFDAALEYLKSMDNASWGRPSKAGNLGIVSAVRWGTLPKKYSTL